MGVDMKAGETKKLEQAEIKKGDTQWTMGIGLGVFDYHLYPGAKQTNRLIFPAPYFTYRSPKFEVDRGIKVLFITLKISSLILVQTLVFRLIAMRRWHEKVCQIWILFSSLARRWNFC